MVEILHYPHANITLNDDDEIRVEYIRKSPYNAKTLKRLTGWVYNTELIGRVKNGVVEFQDKKGKHRFSHCVYNIELYIMCDYLRLLSIRQEKQLKLW